MRPAKACLLVTVLACAILELPQALWAQAVWGAVTGYVRDSSGAAIPQAAVMIKNERTGILTKGIADASGFYNVTHLDPGLYMLSIESRGFQRFVREHIILQVGATVRVDARLGVGSVRQSVTVTAAPPILNTEKTEVSNNFDSEQVQTLPVSGNNETQLYNLVPSVLRDDFQMGSGENPQGTNRTFVHGVWSGAQVYVLDGITDVDYGFSGIQVIDPPPDSIQEVKITTADYDPEFGNTAGMVAQYVTRSGTNQIHGSAYAYNQNAGVGFAADPFTQKLAGTGPHGTGLGVSPWNWNQDGASVGGPIKKNKAFFFGDYQWVGNTYDSNAIATVPNNAFRSGDFSAYAATDPIFSPYTGNPDGTGRSVFPGNQIPAALISPVATKLLDLLPAANLNQNTNNNFLGTEHTVFNTNEFDTRVDWNIGDRDKMFSRYSLYQTYLTNPGIFGIAAGGPTSGYLSPEVAHTLSQQAALNYTHTFGATLFTEFRAGFNRFHINALQADSALDTDTSVGIPNINVPGDPLTGGLAGMNVEGPLGGFTMGITSGVGIPRFEGSTTYEIVDNWTKLMGSHQFLWGAEIQRQDFNFLSVNASSRGNFTFDTSLTASPAVADSGLGVASFLLGLPSEFDRAIFTQFPGERQTRIGIYGQDTWRISPKLTANLGLRWDYFEPVKPAHAGGIANFDPATGDILLAGLGQVSDSANVSTPKDDFSPRIGLAYRLTQKTVVRAGFGQSYFSSGYDATFYHLTSFYPITAQQTIQTSNIYQYIFPISQGPPPSTPPALPSSGILPAPNGTLLKTRPFNWLTENMYAWNFTVERQIGANATLSVGYVGTSGDHLTYGARNLNAAPPGVGPLVDRRPFYKEFGLTQPIDMQCNCVSSNYNALAIGLTKRFSKYYTLTSNFTWSKMLGYYQYNPVDTAVNYGVGGNTNAYFESDAGIDRAAVWNLGYSIVLPYGPGLRWGSGATGATRFLLGGWQLSGIWTAESGLPFTPFVSSNTSLNADFGQVADRVPGVALYQVPGGRNFTHWFNPQAFAIPACCQYGDAAPGTLRGPGAFNADISLWKGWNFKSPLSRENTTLQLRWEMFNAFNYTNAGVPNNDVDTPVVGQITDIEPGFPMREMQLGIHLQW
jgi:outer membrane receptor protein involved in Fe transport